MLFFVVCTGAFLFSIVNVIKKYLLDRCKVHEDLLVVVLMLSASVFCFAAALVWPGGITIQRGFWLPFVITGTLNIAIQYWGVTALKYEDVSIVAPLAGSMPLFLVFTSWLILGEFPTRYGLLGILLIALGSYVLYLQGTRVSLPAWMQRKIPTRLQKKVKFFGAPWLRLFSSRGARLALYTAILASIAVNFDKLAIVHSSPMFYSGSFLLVVGVFVYGWSKISGRWDTIKKDYVWKISLLGLLLGIVTVLMNSGYLFGIVPYVGTLRRTQILWTVLFASIFLKEKNSLLRIVGAIIIFLGVVLIAF